MSQVNSYSIANQSGALVRAQLNSVLGAILTQAAGPTEPPETHPYQLWINTSELEGARVLRIRNAANTAWLKLPFSVGVAANLGSDALTAPAITTPQVSVGAHHRITTDGTSNLTIMPTPFAGDKGVRMSVVTGVLKSLAGGFGFPDGSLAPTAGIIQIKTAVKAAAQSIVPGGAWTSIADLSVSITPQSTASTFVVWASVPCARSNASIVALAVRRNGSRLAAPTSPGSRTACDISWATPTSAYDIESPVILHLDAPATASTITYDVAAYATGSDALFVNRSINDSNAAISPRTQARLIVAEIGGNVGA